MANNFAAFFETLVAGADEYNQAKVGRTALLDAVYKDIKPEAARIGKTVDVYFPDVGPLQAINNGQLTATSVNPNYIPLVFQTRAGAALQFQDFEQWQTAVDLAQKFFDPLYKRAREYLNGQIAALITSANFNANAPIIGATQGEVQVADQLNAWGTLADQKVPLEDRDKLRLMVHNQVYRKMLGDSAWVQESLVSAAIANEARQQADVGHAFNFQVIWDQQMPTASGTILYGQVDRDERQRGRDRPEHRVHPAAHGRDVSYLTFGNDPTKTQYKVATVTSDTAIVAQLELCGGDGHHDGPADHHPGWHRRDQRRRRGHRQRHRLHHGPLGRPVDQRRRRHQHRLAALPDRHDHARNTAAHRRHRLPTTAIAAARSATVQAYTNLALHEYAIALALRPIATPDEARNVVDVSYIDLMGIPLRVMVSYVHIYQALFVTVDFGYALGVIRPDFGVIIQS